MRIAGIVVGCLLVAVVGDGVVATTILNPRVVHELRTRPEGDRARRVMLLTLPSGRAIPVNDLREGETVYAAAFPILARRPSATPLFAIGVPEP